MTSTLLLWLAFQIAPPSEIIQHIKAGVEARQQGHLVEAIAEFKKVTELDPQQAAAFVNLGSTYLENREYGSAIVPLKRALELDNSLIGAHQLLGYALLAQGFAAESIPHLEEAKAFDALGIAQLEIGNLPEAVASLQKALEKRPNDPDVLYYLQRASGVLSKESFDSLVSDHPDSPRAHQALGESYAILGRVSDAEKEFLEALRIRPDTPGIHLALGELYSNSSQWEKAEKSLSIEASLRPGNAQAAFLLGSALLQQGKVQEARKELERADELRPRMPETLYALGKACQIEGDTGAAEKHWTQLLQIESETNLAAQTHFGLANMYRRQGKIQEADREMMLFRKWKSRPTSNR